MKMKSTCLALMCLVLSSAPVFADEPAANSAATDPETPKVSFHKQIKPILQAHCQGCHQPAKASGEYLMTDFAKLLSGGESGTPAIIPGQPDDSNLVLQITATDGVAAMPPNGKPLSDVEVELVRNWIAQ